VRFPLARRRPTGRFPALRQGQRRESLWIGIDESITTLAAANSATLIGTFNAAALALLPFTVVRTRIYWTCGSDQTAADEDYYVALGASIVSIQAAAIGVTAVPTPFIDLNSDLFFLIEMLGNRTIGTQVDAISVMTRDVDSKAMRKVEEGNQVAIVLENSSVSSGSRSITSGRMLVKLH